MEIFASSGCRGKFSSTLLAAREMSHQMEIQAIFAAYRKKVGKNRVQKQFVDDLNKFSQRTACSSSFFSNVLRSKVGTTDGLINLHNLCKLFASSIDLDYSLFIDNNNLTLRPDSSKLDPIAGIWLLLNYRAQRLQPGKRPERNIRISLLEVLEKPVNGKRSFRIVTPNTNWKGLLYTHDAFIYFQGSEHGNDDAERMTLIAKAPASTEIPMISQGIICGVVRGGADNTNPPIYASKSMLYKSAAFQRLCTDPQYDFLSLKQYCAYSNPEGIISFPNSIDAHLKNEITNAIQMFIDHAFENDDQEGLRIIIR